VIREKNKNLRRIYEDEGLDYGLDTTEDGLAERAFKALNLCRGRVTDVLEGMKAARELDLCFLIDVTSSMQPHINGVRESIRSIVEKLTAKHVSFSKQQRPLVKKVRSG
jgi:uncharacterized protein with von Willebrand factor type A (vWA) domain